MSANIILNGLSREEFQNDILQAFSKALGRDITPDSFGGCINGLDFSFEGQSKKKKNHNTYSKRKVFNPWRSFSISQNFPPYSTPLYQGRYFKIVSNCR